MTFCTEDEDCKGSDVVEITTANPKVDHFCPLVVERHWFDLDTCVLEYVVDSEEANEQGEGQVKKQYGEMQRKKITVFITRDRKERLIFWGISERLVKRTQYGEEHRLFFRILRIVHEWGLV